MAASILTAERLKEVVSYDCETGVFTRIVCNSHWYSVGDRADSEIKSSSSAGYRIVSIGSRNYYAHRLAWLYMTGAWPEKHIDHLNGVRGDNRFENLRDVPNRINRQNISKAQKNNKSGLLGASWHKKDKNWRSRISVNRKTIYLGVFKTAEDAHQAYLEGKRKHHEGCTI